VETVTGHAAPASVVSERITMAPPEPRLSRVTAWMAACELDALVVTGAALVNWLAGYSRYYGGPAALVIDPAGHRTLIVMRDELAAAEETADAETVLSFGERGFGLELAPAPILIRAALGVPCAAAATRLGVAGDLSAVVSALSAATVVAGDDDLHQLSLVKDADELVKIFWSYELCWLAHTAIAAGTAAGATEVEMFSAAHAAASVGHGSPVEFGADVLAGPRTAEVCAPVAIAGPHRARPGEPVVADLSVGAAGYWADTCRTYVNGASAQVDEMRAQLYQIMDAGAAQLRAGTPGSSVFGEISGRIAAAWPGGEFPHHGGHSVGLSVFDDPHVIPADSRPVQSWMVMALEPGVYLPGKFGVRTENLFLVTPDGGVELAEAMARPLSTEAAATWRR
jgi:Xaa-Pro aminopeptidase